MRNFEYEMRTHLAEGANVQSGMSAVLNYLDMLAPHLKETPYSVIGMCPLEEMIPIWRGILIGRDGFTTR